MGNSITKTLTVQTVGGENVDVIVRKLALGDYGDLLRALKRLPGEFGKFLDGTDNKDLKKMDLKKFMPHIPELIADCVPEFATVIAIPSNKDADFFLTEVDLADSIDVLSAALELNDINRVITTVKKMMPQKPTAPVIAESVVAS